MGASAILPSRESVHGLLFTGAPDRMGLPAVSLSSAYGLLESNL